MDYGISSQQFEVICALSSGATMTAAAEQAGIHRNTINNWRRNSPPFQNALAHAQYDRALLVREQIEEHLDLAFQALRDLLADPKTPASIRLKAALAIIQTAATPPEPKKQIELEIQKIVVQPSPAPEPVHNIAQSAPPPILHNSAQSHPKIGRNEPCPCKSGLKFKRCCLNKPAFDHRAAA